MSEDIKARVIKVNVLHGHTSPETAYVVDDYPYGYTLRCKIRYWIETAAKGAKKGQQRFMSQTTNPKVAREVWNKPKGSTYSRMAWMYVDVDGNPDTEGHVKWTGISEYGVTPEQHARYLLAGLYEQMTDEDRAAYDFLVRLSQKYAQPWQEFAETVKTLRAYVAAHGQLPEPVNSVVEIPAGTLPGRNTVFRRYVPAWVTVAAVVADESFPLVELA